MNSHRIATEFVKIMDSEDLEPSRQYLAEDCCYQVGETTYLGPEAILNSYKEHHDFAKMTFDSVVYKSELIQKSEQEFEVTYIDIITYKGKIHTYKCKQHLSLNSENKITKIVHENIPGEADRIKAFYTETGLQRL